MDGVNVNTNNFLVIIFRRRNNIYICLSCSTFQANPLVNSWHEDSVENFIPHSVGTEMKNNDDFSTLKEHRRIKKEMAAASYSKSLQKGGGASVIGDSRKRRSEFGLNEDSEGVAEVMKNTSRSEDAGDSKAKVLSEKSSVSETEVRPDQPEGDSALKTELSILETPSDQSAKEVTELNVPNSMLSMKNDSSVGNTAELPKDPPSILDYKKSDKIHEDPSKLMTADSEMKSLENNSMSKAWKSSVDTEGIDIPEIDDDSQRMLKIRGVEGIAASDNLISENNMSGLQGVESEDPLAEVYGHNLHSTVGNMGFEAGLLSDINNHQGIEDNVTKHMTDMQWNNYNLNKNDNYATMPSHNTEALFKQFRSYINSQISESLHKSQEQKSPMSLENFNNVVEPRYVTQDQPSYYYTQNADDVENLKDTWNGHTQMCVVPCWRGNYVVQPYPYGLYVPGSDQNYVTGVHVPQVTLPQAYLPPMQFPDVHSGATAFSSVSIGGHEDHANANQNAHNQNYAVTGNAYGGSSQGSHIYGGSSHSYVKEPLKHLEYSVTTPQKVLHTSLILKAPLLPAVHPLHPNQYVHPYVQVAEKNINLHKSTYF
jgi:hypothetical protein